MSVYTLVTRPQLNVFLADYDIGAAVSCEGILDGIANSNYSLTTTHGEFVLTLFESQRIDELSHCVELLRRLSESASLYPLPIADRQGRYLRELNGKPSLLCRRLPGRAVETPTVGQCRQIGERLARLHLAVQDHRLPIASRHALPELQNLLTAIGSALSADDRELIADELLFQHRQETRALPTGAIHGDLFLDNVLFDDGQISGIVDFYSACHDSWLRDIAICANDWCCENGVFRREKFTALLSAYDKHRPLTEAERQHCGTALRSSALRFWLSRLVHRHGRRAASLTSPKDPFVFRQLLIQHRQSPHV